MYRVKKYANIAYTTIKNNNPALVGNDSNQ